MSAFGSLAACPLMATRQLGETDAKWGGKRNGRLYPNYSAFSKAADTSPFITYFAPMPLQSRTGHGRMQDYSKVTLGDARREYLATSTTAMPIGGLVSWTSLAAALYVFGDRLPGFAPYIAAALPFPLAIVIDKFRGRPGLTAEGRHNPITQLFMRFISVVALLIPFVVIAAQASADIDILILGLAILAGLMWVPHGWGADDPAGFVHFVFRALICYAAYLLAPEALRGAAIAAAAALTYIYAIAAMKNPSSAF